MLSTPPAFILSQDQTLCKNVCSGPRQPLGYLFPFYCFKGQFLEFFTSRRSSTSRKKLILEIFQGCFTVQLSMFFIVLLPFYISEATSISYHIFLSLSTTFLKLFLLFLFAALSSEAFVPLVRNSLYRLSLLFGNVKYFFHLFYVYFRYITVHAALLKQTFRNRRTSLRKHFRDALS